MKRHNRKSKLYRMMLFGVWPLMILATWGMEWINREMIMKRQRVISFIDKLVIYLFLPLILFFAWAYSHAAELDQIGAGELTVVAEQAAMNAVSQPGISTTAEARIDSRVAMPACNTPLKSKVHSQTASAMSIAVSCDAPQPWVLYVPVRLTRQADVLVLSSNVSAGTVLDASHLSLQTRDIGQLAYGYLVDPKQVIGNHVRRPLQAGWALSNQDIEAPNVVRRGDTVTLVARVGSVEVRAEGQALSDAGIEETVRVKNMSTRRIVDGRVTAEGLVAVGR